MEPLTVDRHQVEERPGGPMLANRTDALGQETQDGLKRPGEAHMQQRARSKVNAGRYAVPTSIHTPISLHIAKSL